jgi:hypothetical protein
MTNLMMRPTVRFVAGFVFACFLFVPVMWVIQGPPNVWFLAPMIAVGIVCGLLWVRYPPRFKPGRPPTT